MLNTLSLNRRPARTGFTRSGAAAAAIGGAVLAGGLFLAGCSGSAGSSGAVAFPPAPGAARAAAPGAALAAPAASAAAGSAAKSSGAGTTARLAPASDIIYTAQLTVRAANVSTAASRGAQIAEDVGGYVSNENTSANPAHPSEATATVQLKLPVASYPATLLQLANSLGTQLSLQQHAMDVTEQVADVNSQVTSFQAAIAQLRALLSHAGSIGDLLTVQNQINDEESALEALQAQQRALSHETSYATVSLTILGPTAKPVVHHHPPKAPPSLAGGLGTGWHALRLTVSWVLAFLGVVLPFAAVAALAGFAVYQGRRWLIRRRPAARPASPEN
jgi:pyruvate/2-oxoglutarate dehydrogenase complex dihydrolipoamide acyltransferase (E2) component